MIAVVVIATERRRTQVWERVVPSIVAQAFDEVVVVGDWIELKPPDDVRYLCVAPLARSTVDALVKRDVGTLATVSDTLVYVCDDHALGPRFEHGLRDHLDDGWDVLVPNRCTKRDDAYVWLNNGFEGGYCGGHAGVFKRWLIAARPWSSQEHHRNWDYLATRAQLDLGAIVAQPQPGWGIVVEDICPELRPWE